MTDDDPRPGDETVGGTEPFLVTVDLRPGTVFHGRYEILGPLGKGGMGMVYKAHDRRLDEVVAIKVLRPDFGADPTMAERFRSEIKIARRIRHRNVCAIHDYGEDRGLLYISMEYVEGVDLKRLLRQTGALAADRGYEVAIQIAEGLQAVHDAGIVHRDLKTPNIMSDGTGTARLMDFGVAKRMGEGAATVTGQIVGTPEYMSPEQAQGHKVDTRSDIYALGIVLYEIFTGQVPFRGETPISTILKHLNEPPPLEGPQAVGIPATLKPVLRKCLAKDPSNRYSTARDVRDALEEARHPSRRQQPMATEVLQAPTLPRGTPPRTGRSFFPWLFAIPVVLAAVAIPFLRGKAPAEVVTATTLAAALSTTLPAAVPVDAPPAIAVTPLPSLVTPTPAVRPSPSPRPSAQPSRPPVTVTAAVVVPPTTMAVPGTQPPAPAAPAGPGQMQVVVKPWGEVTVDGRPVGTTPLDRLTLSAGPHLVIVRHPLYEPWEGRVTVRAGQTERVVVDFPAEGRRRQ